MKKNTGTTDRIIRIVIGVLTFILIFAGVLKGLGAIIPGIFAGILLLTGALGLCPIYQLFGLHSLRTKSGLDA
jgi:hypothetical protein